MKLLEARNTLYDLQVCQRKPANLEERAIPFSGSLRHHYNPSMMILITHPLESSSMVYEFRVDDVLYAEELSSLTNPNGVSIERIKLWIRKGSPAMKMKPILILEEQIEDECNIG